MIAILRTSSDNPDFVALVKLLDADLAERDGEDHAFYSRFNKIDTIRHVIVAYENDTPVGCGAMKEFSPGTTEIKRMYVAPAARNRGIARRILSALEKWASELSYQKCVLETGRRQPEAISLYTKNGYQITENYGQYAGVPNSVCFEKKIST